MTQRTSSTTDTLGYHFFRLPRELRDLIYSYVVRRDTPTHLKNAILQQKISRLSITTELLEAEYTYNTFVVTFSNPNRSRISVAAHSIWGAQPEYKRFIRNLIVEATETRLVETELLSLERECSVARPEIRKEWAELLDLPRLSSLTINMQKYYPSQFTWANFSPIIYQLRSKIPKLKITFNISFDVVLWRAWSSTTWDPRWSTPDDDYGTMGYVDVSDLIEAPSEEDRIHVEQYCAEKKIETKGRDAVVGLLGEFPASKRTLAPYYVVKEPSLLRVLMEEHWEIYKKCRQDAGKDEQL